MSELDYRDAQIVSLATRVRQLEEREISREGRYQALLQSLDVGIIVRGPQRQIALRNRRALDLLGLPDDERCGLTPHDPTWSLVDEAGRPLAGCEELLDACWQQREPQTKVVGVKKGDDQAPVWILLCVRPQLDDQGAVEQVVATLTDVSVCFGRRD